MTIHQLYKMGPAITPRKRRLNITNLLSTRTFPMRPIAVIFLLIASIFPSCEALIGKEIGRLPVNALSTDDHSVVKEVDLDLKSGNEIAFWSDMDLSYTQPLELRWQIQVLLNSTVIHEMELDPLETNVTVGSRKTQIIDDMNWSYIGKNGKLTIPEDGHYTFKARLIAKEDHMLTLRKAELVIKQ